MEGTRRSEMLERIKNILNKRLYISRLERSVLPILPANLDNQENIILYHIRTFQNISEVFGTIDETLHELGAFSLQHSLCYADERIVCVVNRHHQKLSRFILFLWIVTMFIMVINLIFSNIYCKLYQYTSWKINKTKVIRVRFISNGNLNAIKFNANSRVFSSPTQQYSRNVMVCQ